MWICLTDAFFSIVSKDCKPSEVLVRARRAGDIEKVFNDELLLAANGLKPVTVTRYTKSDYLYRAVVPRRLLMFVMAAEIDRIVYNNFKGATRDPKLHTCYNLMWNAHADMQELPPYSGSKWDAPNMATKTRAIRDASADMFEGMFGEVGDFGSEMGKAFGKTKKKSAKKLTKGQ